MNEIETKIVAKFHDEILAAASNERAAIVNDLYSFLGVVEKRIALSATEANTVLQGIYKSANNAQANAVSADSNISSFPFMGAVQGLEDAAAKLGEKIKSDF